MRMWRRRAALGAAVVAIATGACAPTETAGEASPEVDPAAAAELVGLVRDTRLLELELGNAENRIVRTCLEARGFTVHDAWELADVDVDAAARSERYPYETWLPDAGTAAETGFGLWAGAPEAAGSAEAAAHLERVPGRTDTVDNSAFEGLSEQRRRDWYFAYAGEDWARAHYAAAYLTEGGLAELHRSGGAPAPADAEPGGCLREMIESLYGETRLTEEAALGGADDPWNWRPSAPVEEYDLDRQSVLQSWDDRLAGPQAAMLDCLDGRGHADWRFDREGGLPVRRYWQRLYGGGVAEGDGRAAVPEPPDDLPGDFEGRRAAEIDMAVDFAACADASGYREAARAAWDVLLYEHYSSVESQLRDWREAVIESLDRARGIVVT
ncbi:hypothetical protein GCM10027447_00780 [Glycomyces halotolerans]